MGGTWRLICRWPRVWDTNLAGLNTSCGRYNEAYPYLMNTDTRMGEGNRTFDFIACSGAITTDVISSQTPQMTSEYDLITLSIGGNDAGLSDILDACIFQWSGGNDQNCTDQLQKSQDIIDNDIPQKLDAVLAALRGHLSPGSKLYHTGYARFFDTSSKGCDNVTWAVWYSNTGTWQKQYLTEARRQQLNGLVGSLNDAIKAAVGRAGDQMVFVDYDQYFTMDKGLYCEPGVLEPAPNRAGLLFYELGSDDNAPPTEPDDPNKGLSAADSDPRTFEGQIFARINKTLKEHPDAVTRAQHQKGEEGRNMVPITQIVPDSIRRVFHPRPAGHAIIANLVFWYLTQDRAIALNQPAAPLQIQPAADRCLGDY